MTLLQLASAHYVPVSGVQIGGIGSVFSQVDLVREVPSLRTLRAVPILLTALGGLMMVEAVGYTRRLRHIFENSSWLLLGYLPAGLLIIVLSGAQPGVTFLLVIAAVVASAVTIGAKLGQRLAVGVPVVALTSLGGLAAVGLLVLIGGFAILTVIGPFIGISFAGTALGGLLAWTARNTPR